MAADLYSTFLPYRVVRVTMDATAGDATELRIHPRYRRVRLAMKQAGDVLDDSMKVAPTGPDGAAIGNDHMPYPSGQVIEERFSGASKVASDGTYWSLYVAAGTNTALLHIALYEAE